MAGIGPYSRLLQRGSVDGRSRSGRFLKAFEDELVAHLGGKPSTAQILLIKNLAVLALRCALMEEKIGEDGTYGDRDGRQFLAWSNALTRGLREIGFKSAPPPGASLSDLLAANSAARASEAA